MSAVFAKHRGPGMEEDFDSFLSHSVRTAKALGCSSVYWTHCSNSSVFYKYRVACAGLSSNDLLNYFYTFTR